MVTHVAQIQRYRPPGRYADTDTLGRLLDQYSSTVQSGVPTGVSLLFYGRTSLLALVCCSVLGHITGRRRAD